MILQLLRRLLPSSVSSVPKNRCYNCYRILLIASVLAQIQFTLSERWIPQEDIHDNLIYNVPSFTVRELLQPNLLSIEKELLLFNTLSSTGLLAVSFDDDEENTSRGPKISGRIYDNARTVALSGLCSCAEPSDSESNDDTNPPLFRTVVGNRNDLFSSPRSTTLSRTTLATATAPNNVPLSLPTEELTTACGFDVVQAMETLRDTIAEASEAFIQTVDHLLYVNDGTEGNWEGSQFSRRRRPPLLRTATGELFPTMQSVIQSAMHLEHFHVYRLSGADEMAKPLESLLSDVNQTDLILDVHTDAGLFLSFVPGLSCPGQHDHPTDRASNGLYVQTPGIGQLQEAIFPPNSVGILLGIGMQQWLATSSTNSANLRRLFQATKHAVFMKPGTTRSWYGRMHLVPPETIIQEFPVQRTFADLRKAMVISGRHSLMNQASDSTIPDDRNDRTSISIGCGSTTDESLSEEQGQFETVHTNPIPYRRRLQMVADASVCNNSTEFYCWMSCLSIPDAEHSKAKLNDGLSLYCADPAELERTSQSVAAATKICNEYTGNRVIIGGAMNTNCIGVWQPTADNVPATDVIPSNTTDDDTSSSDSESTVDDEKFCYSGTSMYMDGFHWLHPVCVIYLFPSWILSTAGALVGACFGTIAFGLALEGIIRHRRDTVSEMPIGWKRLSVSTILYGIQLTAGYMIMLVVMTYSGPLFFSVIIGLMGGHFLWNMKDIFDANTDAAETGQTKKSINYTSILGEVAESVPHETPNSDDIIPCCCSPDATEPNDDHNTDAIDDEALAPCCSSPELNDKKDTKNASNTNGSIARESNYVPPSVTSGAAVSHHQQKRNQSNKTKKKNIVPEGSTPCCQNAL